MEKYNITIATVCRNAQITIRTTIESVLAQTYNDFEYIIIDGLSTDSTYNIVCEYDEAFKKRGIRYRHISEKDKGIFDAMNKAVLLSDGIWINYMNADDSFHNKEVLKEVFSFDLSNIDVVYGDTLRVKNGIGHVGKGRPADDIYLNMPFCHQSGFVRSYILKEQMFDLNYYSASDYNFFLNIYLKGKQFKYVEIIVANYSLDGFSNQNKYKTYLETLDIKHSLKIINKNSVKQKIKNYYFKMLLSEEVLFHPLICKIDNAIMAKKRNVGL